MRARRRRPDIEFQLLEDGQMIGWAKAVARKDHDVIQVFVSPTHRKRGHGRKLVEAAKSAAQLAWGRFRGWCDCARDLRRRDQPEHHAGWCSERSKENDHQPG